MNNEEKNIQLQPVSQILVPIDKLSPGLFGVEDLKLTKVDDKKNQYTFTDSGVNVPIYLSPPSGEKLETSDFAIFCAACSEYASGNEVFTIRRLWKKIGGGGYHLSAEMKKFISDSVEKLRFTKFSADLSKINEKFKYEGEKFFKSYLLPLESIEKRINGQISDEVFHFLGTPPLLKIAQNRKQFTEYDYRLLDVPTLRTTATTLNIKFYLFYRVITIIGSHNPHKQHFGGKGKDGKIKHRTAKKLPPIIALNTLYEKCGLSDADKGKKRDARTVISKVMEHFKAQGRITDWHFEPKNGKIHSIHFDFATKISKKNHEKPRQ